MESDPLVAVLERIAERLDALDAAVKRVAEDAAAAKANSAAALVVARAASRRALRVVQGGSQ